MRAGRLGLALILAVGLGCARHDWIDRTLVTESVTGVWAGSFGEGNSFRQVRLELQQQGAKVTGSFWLSLGGTPVDIDGSVAGDVFTFKTPRGAASAELTISGDDMTGHILGSYGTRQLSLRRIEPSAPAPR